MELTVRSQQSGFLLSLEGPSSRIYINVRTMYCSYAAMCVVCIQYNVHVCICYTCMCCNHLAFPRLICVSLLLCSNSGGNLSKQDWTIQWPTTETGKENNPACAPEPTPWLRTRLSQSPRVQSKCAQHYCHASPTPGAPGCTHVHRLTVDAYPGLCPPPPLESGHRSLPPSPRQRHAVRTPPRTPNIVTTVTPPGTPPVRKKNKLKPPGTPPPSSRKLIHLIPGFTTLHRSKSHEFQLGHRVDEAHTPK